MANCKKGFTGRGNYSYYDCCGNFIDGICTSLTGCFLQYVDFDKPNNNV